MNARLKHWLDNHRKLVEYEMEGEKLVLMSKVWGIGWRTEIPDQEAFLNRLRQLMKMNEAENRRHRLKQSITPRRPKYQTVNYKGIRMRQTRWCWSCAIPKRNLHGFGGRARLRTEFALRALHDALSDLRYPATQAGR